ncbi:DUF1146 family protein [Amphibacillus sp. MSJ-3]|uniref:DUF1146 family protein n=1 Tax=Amphibacillus sp. MSJ-3 TaxID=2841505 RepID=UPI001C0E95B1|nr:DUF1146 family protein [Amphibacillus sp. MSJ-3]MBU5594340.1 DUF1146 family protein [Amphibacillus sp. MSJ-3]
MIEELGTQALMSITSHIVFIIITWQVLQAVRLDEIFKKNRIFEARIVIIFLTITIGATVSNFFLDLIHWTQQLLYLF